MKAEAYAYSIDKAQKPLRLPDFTANDVFDIDFALLAKLGVKHVIFDLDATIRTAYSKTFDAEIISYFKKLESAYDFESVSLATNNIRNISAFGAPFGARIFQPYLKKGRPVYKPHRDFFKRILSTLGAKPQQVVMIGDKINTDIVGANRSGFFTVLVSPRGGDYWYETLLLTRYREKRALHIARQKIENPKKRRFKGMFKRTK